ncbi:MAG: hypothetical protein ACI8RD_006427 [Bacillariaceae sp.]|jgi:hypothetical protein
MAQTNTMTKLRGRHYAARAARANAGSTPSTTNDVSSNNNNNNISNSIRHSHRFINSTTRNNSSDYNVDPNTSSRNNNISSNNNNNNNNNDTIINDGSDGDGDGIDREMQLVQGISDRLETGLNEFALQAILDLLKRGEHPDAIVAVVTSLAQRPTTR